MTAVTDTPRGRSGCDTRWTLCPVTLNALALLSDRAVGHMLNQVDQWTSTRTRFDHHVGSAHDDLVHLWAPIVQMRLRAWAHGRFTVDLDIAKADGSLLRFVDQDFAGIGLVPATVLTALKGRPLAAYCDHPVFHGLHFEEEYDGIPRSPMSTIPLDGDLGTGIMEARRTLLLRYPAGVEKSVEHAGP